MKSLLIRLCLITFVLLLAFSSCSKKSSDPAPTNNTPTLAVKSLSVTSGPYNTTVVITGTAFSSTIANDQVFFNGKAAVITAATSTQLTATVPLGAGTGNISVVVDGKSVTGPVFTYQMSAVVTTFAGTGQSGSADGNADKATFNFPVGLAFDASDNLYVADNKNNLIRKITPQGVVSTFAGSGSIGAANGAATAASFSQPGDLSFDSKNNLYVSDTQNNLIRKITPQGIVSTFAGSGISGSDDGLGIAASFEVPLGLVIDAADNLIVANVGYSDIRKITPAGLVTTIVSSNKIIPIELDGLIIDKSGNVYIPDPYHANIRKMTVDYTVSTITGFGSPGHLDGTLAEASFVAPTGGVSDAAGNLYITDGRNYLIRKIDVNGNVSTVAGTGQSGSENGIGVLASFNLPTRMAIDASGNLYIADTGNNLIRKISFQ